MRSKRADNGAQGRFGGRKRKAKILLSALLSAAVWLGSAGFASAATFLYGSTPLEMRMDALEELIGELRETYKDETDLDSLFDGMYAGLLESLGDPWSVYVVPGKDENYVETEIEEAYEGIGILIRNANSGIRIMGTVLGSPAQEAGIRTGDYLLKVNSTDVTQMQTADVSQLIRGTAGSSVTLTIDRDGEVLTLDIARTAIHTASVMSKMLDGGIGYVKIDAFRSKTGEEFAEAYDKLAADGAKGLVLDLRGNGGGSVEAAVETADHLLHKIGIIATFERQGKTVDTVVSEMDDFADLPAVCLVDRRTASASELLAAALQDRGAAKIVGETTYGKGVAQAVLSAGRGKVFKYSIAYFVSPRGRRIDGAGIVPDVAVYAPGGFTREEIASYRDGLAPLTEERRYYAGESGLNVYGAQQRLAYMGYDVDRTGVMDAKTVAALKLVQAEAGVCPYGVLDFCTLGIVRDKFESWLSPAGEDEALAKALELLK
ncbi:MAG: PDZ domain-containing protein [Clostridia bacterium]|nr:PDZ domain-containing protein [Clostridia bacterium]